MAGFGIDKTPAPKKTIGFELPDSDAKIYSLGARYRYSERLEIGAAALHSGRESLPLTAVDRNDNRLVGTVEAAGALVASRGAEYRFDWRPLAKRAPGPAKHA